MDTGEKGWQASRERRLCMGHRLGRNRRDLVVPAFSSRSLVLLAAAFGTLAASVPVSAQTAPDRSSFAYQDLRARLMQTRSKNSIAIHMMAENLRSGGVTGANFVDILKDHKAGLSAAQSFKQGRAQISYKGSLRGGIRTNPLVERFGRLGGGVQGGFDLETIKMDGALLPLSGRVQRQTGQSFVLGDEKEVIKGCGVLGAEGSKGFAVVSGSINLGVQACYQYDPGSFTPLAAYELKHDAALAKIEMRGGEDVALVADVLYQIADSLCGNLVARNPTECGPAADMLAALQDAGFATDLPTTLRTRAEVEADAAADPATSVVLKRIDENGAKVTELERRIGRKLTKMEAEILATLADGQLTPEQIRTFTEQGLMKLLDNPEVQEQLVQLFAKGTERALKKLNPEPGLAPLRRNYDGDEVARKKRLAVALKGINAEHDQIVAYSNAMKVTVDLVAALNDNPELARDFARATAALQAVNELVRSGRALSAAADNGLLFSAGGIAAYTSGVGAALTLISLFSGSDQPSELEVVVDYLDQRLDVVDAKLDILLERTAAMDQKLDALLQGQSAIMRSVAENARAIQANRAETLLVRQAVMDLERRVEQLGRTMQVEFAQSRVQASVYLEEQRSWTQEERILAANEILSFWLTPANGVVARLNAGTYSQGFMDDLQRERQKVLRVIDLLSGRTFVRSPEILAQDPFLGQRPPAQEMAMLATYAPDVDFLSGYMLKWRTPEKDFSDFIQRDQYPELFEEAPKVHAKAYPPVPSPVFDDLPNPDALAHLLEGYLTFYAALNDEARTKVGFAELPALKIQIARLGDSVAIAQKAALVLMAQLPETMDWVAEDLEKYRGRGKLFRTPSDSLVTYVFTPGDLHIPEDFRKSVRETPEAFEARIRTFVDGLAADTEAVDFLIAHGTPYLTKGQATGAEYHMDILKRLKVNSADWAFTVANTGQDWMKNLSDRDLRQLNLRWLADLRALYGAYRDGDVFAYTQQDLARLDELRSTPILSMTEQDIEAFIGLVKSDGQLIEFALEEGLLVHKVRPASGDIDVVPDDPARARRHAIVRYETLHSGTLTSETKRWEGLSYITSKSELNFVCFGVRLEPQGTSNWPHALEPGYLFPMDLNGAVYGVGNLATQAINDCLNRGNARNYFMEASPFFRDLGNNRYQYDYKATYDWAQKNPPLAPVFLRHASVVPNGTELFHRGVLGCEAAVVWAPDIAQLPGIDTARDVAVVGQYVRDLLDHPLLFATDQQAAEANKNRIASDGTEIRENFNQTCSGYWQKATYNTFPGAARKGGRKAPIELDAGWRSVPNKALQTYGLRDGVITALLDRRAKLVQEQLAEIAEAVRYPSTVGNRLLRRMDHNGVPRETRRELIQTYREEGRAAFWTHPAVIEYFDKTPGEEVIIREWQSFVLYRQTQLKHLKAFAEWGFGECLYLAEDLAPWAQLIAVQVPETGQTAIQAFDTLTESDDLGRYGLAVDTLLLANERFKTWRRDSDRFPPTPASETSLSKAYEGRYQGLDHAKTLETLGERACTLGHGSITELVTLVDLVLK